MRQTVLGVFDNHADARSAQRALGDAGVAQADIAVYSMSMDAPVEKGPRVYAPGSGDVRQHKPVFDQLEHLFARLFKSGQYPPETEDYREVIRRGGTIVSADVSEMQVDLARDLMRRTGAVDIEERAREWRNDSAEGGLLQQELHQGSSTTRDSASAHEPSLARQRDTIAPGAHIAGAVPPSPTEHLAGPRDTSPLPVAPRASTGEVPAAPGTVVQSAATPAAGAEMFAGMQQVSTRTEGLGSTASLENSQQLSGEPGVGHLPTPGDARASVNTHVGTHALDGRTGGTTTERKAGTGLMDEPIAGTPLDDAPYDDEFREDYDAHYANTGASYDEYQRAYTHGATLGKDDRFRDHDWQRVEANAREDWESRYPESGWERFKAAVRHGWDRVTGGQ